MFSFFKILFLQFEKGIEVIHYFTYYILKSRIANPLHQVNNETIVTNIIDHFILLPYHRILLIVSIPNRG
jgi:hypothetical protein